MKIAITADIHLKMWNDKDVDSDGLPKKLVEILDAFEQLCKHCSDNDIDHVIIAGDLNDTKLIVHARAFVLFSRIIEKYDNISFTLLHGNHDATAGIVSESAIELINGKNVRHIKEVFTEGNISYVPHSKNVAENIQDVVDENKSKILIGHFGLSDASLSSGISLKTNISSANLQHFELVLLGHYHKPQKIENVYYCGSLIPLRRDEHDEEKRFIVFDTETFEVQSILTKGYRKYRQITIDEDTDFKKIDKVIKDFQENGDFVIVRKKIKTIPKSLQETLSNTSIIDQYEEEFQIRGIQSNMDIIEQMNKYLEIKQIDETEREHYITIGKEILIDDK